jgi:hypothetical protein
MWAQEVFDSPAAPASPAIRIQISVMFSRWLLRIWWWTKPAGRMLEERCKRENEQALCSCLYALFLGRKEGRKEGIATWLRTSSSDVYVHKPKNWVCIFKKKIKNALSSSYPPTSEHLNLISQDYSTVLITIPLTLSAVWSLMFDARCSIIDYVWCLTFVSRIRRSDGMVAGFIYRLFFHS